MSDNKYDQDLNDVDTGNGFQNNLIATTGDRLKKTVIELRKLQDNFSGKISGLKSSIDGLEKTTKQLDEKNGKLQSKFFWLTVIATIFTVAQVVQVIDIILRWLGYIK
jgi:archaellum component FlaC